MIRLIDTPVKYVNGRFEPCAGQTREGTIAAGILKKHTVRKSGGKICLKFDAMASHDITYVGIIQTARASGLERFPMPYALTNCHNSLCAVGGTINEDDHVFGLSAAKKYGGLFVPPHVAVIHQYMREAFAGCGRMILGSDSHTRYGPLGTLAVGEGGPELVKQLLSRTYDIDDPEIVGVKLTGRPKAGVGPQDVALALIGAVYKNDFVKNRVMEFFGDGLANLEMDYRLGIDVMTTEAACLSSVWETDEKTKNWLAVHGREQDYARLRPGEGATYDRAIEIDLSSIEPMIALPFHPSNVYTIRELCENPLDILDKFDRETGLNLKSKVRGGEVWADQGIIAGCAGGMFTNIMTAVDILGDGSPGCGAFSLSVYPSSLPIYAELVRNGAAARLTAGGVIIKTAFCGPCFGAGDVPANGALSVRHTTRNFPNREGSRPQDGQSAAVALMDARSIAATALNGGRLTSAADLGVPDSDAPYRFDGEIYKKRVYNGYNAPKPEESLVFGPNITEWPVMPTLKEALLLKIASVISDPVTTTDELIPSGETSSYRSNPIKLAQFTLARKDPGYVGRAKAAGKAEDYADILAAQGIKPENALVASCVCAIKPGDGSAREQAASCQRVLGGGANIATEYATKRYRSNLINWGMLPLRLTNPDDFARLELGDLVLIPNAIEAVERAGELEALLIKDGAASPLRLTLDNLSDTERGILKLGSLMNYYASPKSKNKE